DAVDHERPDHHKHQREPPFGFDRDTQSLVEDIPALHEQQWNRPAGAIPVMCDLSPTRKKKEVEIPRSQVEFNKLPADKGFGQVAVLQDLFQLERAPSSKNPLFLDLSFRADGLQ